mgnify:FL=1
MRQQNRRDAVSPGSGGMKALCITSQTDTLNSIRPEAETLIGLARAGVDMSVMTQGDSVYAEPMREAGIRVVDYAPEKKFDREAIRIIREELVVHRHDILHLFNNKAIANGLIAARDSAVKVITYRGQTGNVHRYDPIAWMTHLSPRIDRIICVANSVRDDLRIRRRDPEHVVTIYKGHDLAWYQDEPADLAALGVPDGAFTVAVVANYRPRKGIEYVVDAARYLPRGVPVHFLLVGADLDRPELARRIAASPVPDQFHLLGFRRDAPAITAACDTSILASVKREGLPKTVIESMVYAVPPVVTDTGGSAELVVHGECGLVVPPRDPAAIAEALMYLWEHPAEREAMGRKARERIDREFNIKTTIAETLALYEDAVSEGPA